jgi:hypothetical protein
MTVAYRFNDKNRRSIFVLPLTIVQDGGRAVVNLFGAFASSTPGTGMRIAGKSCSRKKPKGPWAARSWAAVRDRQWLTQAASRLSHQ